VTKVTVKFYGILEEMDVDRTEEYEVRPGTSVREVIEDFAKNQLVSSKEKPVSLHGQKIWETRVVMLNGTGLSPEKQLTTRLKEGDSVTIYLPVSGG
jgi:molybdopterin converting factor small subunit